MGKPELPETGVQTMNCMVSYPLNRTKKRVYIGLTTYILDNALRVPILRCIYLNNTNLFSRVEVHYMRLHMYSWLLNTNIYDVKKKFGCLYVVHMNSFKRRFI